MAERDGEAARPPGLASITVAGFRSLRKVELEVRPVNILIGANGSGKSNLLDVLSMLTEIRAGRLRRWVTVSGGADQVLHFGAGKTGQISIIVSFDDEHCHEYQLTLRATAGDGLAPTSEIAEASVAEGQGVLERLHSERGEAGISRTGRPLAMDNGDSSPSRFVAHHLDGWHKYHFHDSGVRSPLRATAHLHDNRSLRGDGANLPAFLYRLSRTHPSRYDLIRRAVRLMAPFLDGFVLEPMALNRERIRLNWIHRKSRMVFDVSSLSDGALRWIALVTVLLQPRELRPGLILLDEPELGLHPAAIGRLAALLKRAAVASQILVATQSPVLLDCFEPEDTVVFERRENETVLWRTTSEELQPWLDEFSLGQLREQNELGGRPGGEYGGRPEAPLRRGVPAGAS